MKAGVLGIVRDDFEVVDSLSDTVERDSRELERVLDVSRVFLLPTGHVAFAGVSRCRRRLNKAKNPKHYAAST